MYNKNSGYGLLQAMAVANGLPTIGKFFVVLQTQKVKLDYLLQFQKRMMLLQLMLMM